MLDRPPQAVLERHPRLPLEGLARATDVGLAHLRVVGGERLLDDRAAAAREPQHELGELAYGELVRVADVRRIRPATLEQPYDPIDQVVHVAERTRLRPVAVHRERIALDRLHDEVGHHPAVLWGHAWPVRVEDA